MTLNIEKNIPFTCTSFNNSSNFSVDTSVNLSIYSFLHNIFINSDKRGEQDDR
jgi:hypothetical protein